MTHTLTDLFVERRRALEVDRRVREFWLALDERVHPGMAPPPDAALLDRASQFLFNRLEVRAVTGRAGTTPNFQNGATSRRAYEALSWVSALLRDLHAQHLVTPDGADLTGWALEQFSVGAVATFHGDPTVHGRLLLHGVPNSSEFLKLPELGFACLDHEIDAAFWKPRLRCLLVAAHCFIAAADAPPSLNATLTRCPAYDYREGWGLSVASREAVRETLAARRLETEADYAAEFTRLIASAFRGTAVGAPYQ